ASLASKLEPGKVAQSDRDMSQPFVELSRPVRKKREPLRDLVSHEQEGKQQVNDAWAELDDWIKSSANNAGSWGFLIEGRPEVGKTRLITQWLRTRCSSYLVLVPKPGSLTLPDPHRLLRSRVFSKADGVCLFLDELESYKSVSNGLVGF